MTFNGWGKEEARESGDGEETCRVSEREKKRKMKENKAKFQSPVKRKKKR